MLVIFKGVAHAFRADRDPYAIETDKLYIHDLLVFNVKERTDRHKIAGTVTVDGLPAKRAIIACHRGLLTYVAGTTSDPATGKWELQGLPEYPERSLIVFALDTTGNYNAEVADYVSQVTS